MPDKFLLDRSKLCRTAAPRMRHPSQMRATPVRGVASPRNYTPKHQGIGFEALNLESEACFVPDSSFELLDAIVSEVIRRLPSTNTSATPDTHADRVLAISKTTGDVLAEKGFGLYIPTDTLGDALTKRNKPGEPPRHIFDCDTGALILLTVADSMSVAASMVEITLSSGNGHNYVRWPIDTGVAIDWDTNGRGACATPKNLPAPQGESMSRDQTMAYLLTVRAQVFERGKSFARASEDYRKGIKLFPERAGGYNNFAWMIATKEFQERSAMKQEGLEAAEHAVSINRTPNYLDTLACSYAFAGDFVKAAKYEDEASKKEPGNKVFQSRFEQFNASSPKDCTGAE